MKTYVLVGTGGRSLMYTQAILRDFADVARLAAICDINPGRMAYHNKIYTEELGCDPVPTYAAADFDRMIAEQQPDTVIVTSIDRTHHQYVCRAMELGCDAITEKPLTVDAAKAQQIVDTVERTGKNLTVTFNYRYAPRSSRVKEVLQSGICGDIYSVHFEWLLDTSHGADYFRRWHRDKRNSGGLMVHKATHHFDLMNWWLDSEPELVYALGDLMFYGRANAEGRGHQRFYSRSRGSELAAEDPFALKVTEKDERLRGLYYDAEKYDGYYRDQSVWDDGISIEDTMSVMVRYRNRAVMTYALTAYSPWEGFRCMLTGSKGRLEVNVVQTPYVSGSAEDFNMPGMREFEDREEVAVPDIIFQPQFGKRRIIDYEVPEGGGHEGGDVRLLNDIFRGVGEDPLGHAAGWRDGVNSILTGIAANRSMATGRPVRIADLVTF